MQIEQGDNTSDLDPAASPAAVPDQSDAGTQPDTPEPSPGTDDTAADEPKSLADAIEKAISEGSTTPADEGGEIVPPAKKTDDDAADKPVDEPPSKEPQPEPGNVPDDDPTDAELRAMRPSAQRRVKALLSQRNTARRDKDEIAARYEADRPHAEAYREVLGFMQQARLEQGEVRELFDIGRKLKSNDPKQFGEVLNTLLPLTMGLLELTGRSVPADLQGRVENGEITEDLARQMAKDRAAARIAEQQATTVRADVQQFTQHQQRQQLSNWQTAVKGTVDNWVANVRKTDPDYGRKAAAIEDAAHGILARRGPPQTPEQALAYAQEAYDRVNQAFRAARPALTATRQQPGNGQNGNRTGMKPAPQSLEDAIMGEISSWQH